MRRSLAAEGLYITNSIFSIIAVTGLSGHAFGSWKQRDKPDMWLRDFLPQSIPNARILTYGYDTRLPGSRSEASILELSKRFLESIKTTRSGQAVRIVPSGVSVRINSRVPERSAPHPHWAQPRRPCREAGKLSQSEESSPSISMPLAHQNEHFHFRVCLDATRPPNL